MKQNIYFVGAGGIGMANLVRYFLAKGYPCAGYDRTASPLTHQLQAEGAQLVFEDNELLIPTPFRNPSDTLVVYTPAVPETNRILSWFCQNGFEIVKRARLLGEITSHSKGICVAGSHGKTTTSSMIANIMRQTPRGINAFLGGILRNTGSNFIMADNAEYSVVEADEYDRSFHQLRPQIAVVTSTDPDHLDIYGNEKHYLEAFSKFTSLIRPGGTLITHTGLAYTPHTQKDVATYTYSGGPEGDWHAENIRFGQGSLSFTLVCPDGKRIENIPLGVPVEINVDNAVAAAAAALTAGATEQDVVNGLATFKGAKRRFEIHLNGTEPGNTGHTVLIDDYAHSPNEIEASIQSVRKLYPSQKLTVIFQPHLYTRTRDFAPQFAKALSKADQVIMPEIYPARELPIPGITSQTILQNVKAPQKQICLRKDLLNHIKNSNFEILMTLGAADIDIAIPAIKNILTSR